MNDRQPPVSPALASAADQRFDEVRKIFTAYLERKSLRKTPERFAILEEIYSLNGHFDVEALYLGMKQKNFQISRATVYNTLDLLVETDLVGRRQFGRNLAHYEKTYGYRQHDHVICTECHKVVEFCDPRIHVIQTMVGELLNFSIQHHSLNLWRLSGEARSRPSAYQHRRTDGPSANRNVVRPC
jgi:Fur family transcriptional regulator, ferric uptake regulator